MPTRKIFSVGCAVNYQNWMCGLNASSIEEADLVVFTGGEDVSPELYGAKRHMSTRCNENRDRHEKIAFDKCRALGKKMIGICRGAQFLCVMAGGKLVQHMDNHHQNHDIYIYDGDVISTSSDHHQAMHPWNLPPEKFEILAWSFNQSTFHLGGDNEEMVVGKVPLSMEVEIAYYPGIEALCIQGHPEWQYTGITTSLPAKNAISKYRELLNKFMDGNNFKESRHAWSAVSESA